jgi:iron complex transport system ATP-binding protein
MIEARDLGYRIGEATLVSGVDLALRPGEIAAIGGCNGAGKSTLLWLLAGLLTPTSGAVTLDGRPLAAFPARALARRRALLPQQDGLTQPLLAREVVALGRYPFGGTQALRNDPAVDRALSAVGGTALADRPFTTLSGGERQRIGLARVLAQIDGGEPDRVLLLDEPTSALDLGQQHAVLDILRATARRGVAVGMVLHDLNLAAAWADRLILLRAGRLLADGPPADVLTPSIVAEALGVRVHVLSHPDHGRPQLLVAGSGSDGRA